MVYVFSMAGLHGNINLISSGIQYALFIIFCCFTFFFIDYTGRRPLLIYGAIGMGVCHFVVGGLLGTYGIYTPGGVDGNLNVLITLSPGPVSHTVIAFSYLLIIIYALTLAPVAWVYASEVWSLETRAYGMAIASIANWLFNFALGLFVPSAFHNITWKTFIIFGVLCFGAAVQAFISYPETAQKSLEEIEEMFRDSAVRPWKTKVCLVWKFQRSDANIRSQVGGSQLDAKIEAVKNEQKRESIGEYVEKSGIVHGTNMTKSE
jgi:hypothetical protein